MCPLGIAMGAIGDRARAGARRGGGGGLAGAVRADCALHGPAHQTSASPATVAGGDVESAAGGRRGVDVGGVDFIPTTTGIAKPTGTVVAAHLCRDEFPLLGVGNSAGEGIGHLGEEF